MLKLNGRLMKKKLEEVAKEVEEADPELLEEIRKEEAQKQ
jgi:hypothetical protein